MNTKSSPDRFGDLADVASKQHGVFTLNDAKRASVTRSMLCRNVKSGRFERVGPCTYRCRFAPETFKSRAISAALSTGGVISHMAAAQLWGLARAGQSQDVHVTVTPDRMVSAISRPRPGLTAHRRELPEEDVTFIDNIPVTTVARTLRDLSWLVNPRSSARIEWYWRLIDDALDRGLVELSELKRLFRATNPRCPYSRAFRLAVSIRCGLPLASESGFERSFIKAALNHGWEIETQVQFEWRRNSAQRSDVIVRAAKVIIELDGRRGHSSLSDREADRRRDLEANIHGWLTVRVGWNEFKHHRSLMLQDLDALIRRRSNAAGQPEQARAG